MKKKKISVLSIIIILVTVFVGGYFIKEVVNIIKLDRQEKELKKQNEELQKQQEALSIIYESVKSPEYLENEARSKLKLVRPEEIIYVFVKE